MSLLLIPSIKTTVNKPFIDKHNWESGKEGSGKNEEDNPFNILYAIKEKVCFG